jgi:hypothetical protein
MYGPKKKKMKSGDCARTISMGVETHIELRALELTGRID